MDAERPQPVSDVSSDVTASEVDASVGLASQSLSPTKMAVRRFVHHRAAFVSLIVLSLMVLFVILAPFTARYGVNEAVFKTSVENPNQFLSPRSIAWLGTDDIGRDLYSRLIYGLRISIFIGLAAAVFGTILGVTIGAIAGLRGGWIDDVLMRVTDLFLAFPFLVTLLVLRSVMASVSWLEPIVGKPTSIRFVIVLFVLFGWMGVARLMRSQVLALKETRSSWRRPGPSGPGRFGSCSSICCRMRPVRSWLRSRSPCRRPSSGRPPWGSSATALSRVLGPRRSGSWSEERRELCCPGTGGWSFSRASCWCW